MTFSISTLAAAATAQPGGAAASFAGMVPMLFIFVIFWFLMIRPQQKRMKDHRAQIAAVKKGDKVVTGGGLIGKVVRVGDDEVDVELAPGLKVTAVKSTLMQVGLATPPAND